MELNFLSLKTHSHILWIAYCMQYKWDAGHSFNDLNHKTNQGSMLMRADSKPQQRDSYYEKNTDDSNTK